MRFEVFMVVGVHTVVLWVAIPSTLAGIHRCSEEHTTSTINVEDEFCMFLYTKTVRANEGFGTLVNMGSVLQNHNSASFFVWA
jgi:hypothetical protein